MIWTRADIAGLVLWDPVVNGRDYVAGLEDEKSFPLTASLREESRQRRSDGKPRPRTFGPLLVIASDERDKDSMFCRRLADAGLKPVHEVVPGRKAWIEYREFDSGALPVERLRRIDEFVS